MCSLSPASALTLHQKRGRTSFSCRLTRRMEVITGDVGRRTWSPEEKERILAEAAVPGAVVSEVARRHGLRPQQVFGWRREARAANRFQEEGLVFAPVVLDTKPPPAAPKELPAL
ncbi:hypothetical protein Sp245p_31255 (plasmid) [Azospirillum baldaniorum]|nr:hypothetical protein Sp245p_31255 [Azospirillum baldaniorum]